MRTAAVFVGGPTASSGGSGDHPGLKGPRPDLVVAVDSGLHLADSYAWDVDLVVGDMDSIAPGRLREAEASGVAIEVHPTDKDATDLELALEAVLEMGSDRTVLIVADVGRLDHLFGVVLGSSSRRYATLGIRIWIGTTLVLPVHDRLELTGEPGSLLSIVPLHGEAIVSTQGLRWMLDRERLEPGSTRGISNEFEGTTAVIEVAHGTVAAFLPNWSHAQGGDR